MSFLPSDARIAATDHGFLYGDGVFETFRTYGGRPFRLSAHVARLHAGLAEVFIQGAPSPERLVAHVLDAVAQVALPEAYCRLTVTRGIGSRGLDPTGCSKPTVVLAILPLRPYPADAYTTGMRAIVLWPRARGDRPPPSVKSTSYQRGVLARLELTRRDAGEGFYLDDNANVTEGSVSNVFAVERGVLVTPADGCLRGVTRAEVLAIAESEGIEVSEAPLPIARLHAADEVFITSSLAELVPVVGLEHHIIGPGVPGPMHARLWGRYRERAHRQEP